MLDAAKRLLQAELSPKAYKVPDVEGASANKCNLTRSARGRRFASREVNRYFAAVFQAAIPAADHLVGAEFTLSRYDLFHGHLFLSAGGTIGVLLHAQEYPAFDEDAFSVHLGYCQEGSGVRYELNNMNYRNILWTTGRLNSHLGEANQQEARYEGVLCILDTSPGSALHEQLLMEGLKFVRTIDESDFGYVLADVNYFHVLSNRKAEHRIFFHLA
jgi:hypothetical protein